MNESQSNKPEVNPNTNMGLFNKLFGQSAPAKRAEWSANFDTDTLETLIQRVSIKWPSIVTPQRTQDFMAFVRSLAHNDEKPFSFTAEHEGANHEIKRGSRNEAVE